MTGLAVSAAAAVVAGARMPAVHNSWSRLRLLAIAPAAIGGLAFLSGPTRDLEFAIMWQSAFEWAFFVATTVWILDALVRRPARTLAVIAAAALLLLIVLPPDWPFIYSFFAGGYSPWIVSAAAILLTSKVGAHRSRPDVGVLAGRSIEDGLDVGADRHDTALMRARPCDGGVDQFLRDPRTA